MWYVLAVWAALVGVFADSVLALGIMCVCVIIAIAKDERLYPWKYNRRRYR